MGRLRLRIKFARTILRTGKFIQSLTIMVMKPEDLIDFSLQTYKKPGVVRGWCDSEIVDSGLNEHEEKLLKDLGEKKGQLLLLGVGGGREVIPLSRAGFSMTGVDFVPEMVANAKKNAGNEGIALRGVVQEISQLQIESNRYDVIWFSGAMYSAIPTKGRRVKILRTLHNALVSDGKVVCQFHWDPGTRISGINLTLRKLFALLTMGNLTFEPGDQLWGYSEFIHAFSSDAELEKEFIEGGFEMTGFRLFPDWHRGAAILIKTDSEA